MKKHSPYLYRIPLLTSDQRSRPRSRGRRVAASTTYHWPRACERAATMCLAHTRALTGPSGGESSRTKPSHPSDPAYRP